MRLACNGARTFVLAVFFAVLVPIAGFAGAQAGTFSPNSFALRHNVVVIGPNDPAFDTLLEKFFPGASGVSDFQAVKPLLAIVHNNTRRVVKAYAVTWTIVNADGSTNTAVLAVMREPMQLWTLSGQGTVLGPAGLGTGSALVSPFFHWNKQRFPVLLAGLAVVATFEALAQQIPAVQQPLIFQAQKATSIRVTLDGAVFGDGVFVGPDGSKLYERFEAEQQAQVDEASWMLGELKGGLTNQQLRDALGEQIYNGRNSAGTDSSSLYTAARGRAAESLLSVLSQLPPAAVRRIATMLAGQKPLPLRRIGGT